MGRTLFFRVASGTKLLGVSSNHNLNLFHSPPLLTSWTPSTSGCLGHIVFHSLDFFHNLGFFQASVPMAFQPYRL